MINVFALGGLLLAIVCGVLIFVISKYAKTRIQTSWAFFNLCVLLWGCGSFLIGISETSEQALLSWRLAHIGILFIPISLLHFIYLLCELKKRAILFLAYAQGVLFSILIVSGNPLFVESVRYVPFCKINYAILGPLYHIPFAIWITLVFYSHVELFAFYLKSSGLRRNQISYLFFGTLLGFAGGVTNFLPAYNIDIYPYGNFTIVIYCLIVTYAIFKYRLLDVSLIVTRTGIFISVYSFVLGIPFAIAFGLRDYLTVVIGQIWWIIPLMASTLLGTAGPYLYFFIQRKAEEKLLADQKRYQSTLKQASAGMTRIKDLKKLLNLIVYILSRTVNLTHAFLYLYNLKSRDYTLEAVRGEKLSEKNYYISRRSALIDYLEKAKLPIVAEEVKQQAQDYNNENLKEVYAQLKEVGAEVAVPILTEKRLLAIGVLGKKKTGAMYTPDDLTVFSILASQVALAIENAQFYEESKQTQQQLFQAEKMATIGTMADGLSHQINNRLHTLGFIAGDALDTINLSKDVQDPVKFQAVLAEISKALQKIQDNVRQGGEIVQGLLRYTRKGQEGFGEVVFDKLVDEVVEMAQFKIKKEYVAIIKDYPQDLPPIQGNFTQLQEVFFNIIDNAYDAIMQKKSEIPDENFMGKIKISTRQTERFLEINVLDNGMGVKEDDQTKLFTPFFTTKVSSRKGTGLGLYVIKKIIEDNHQGEVFISSENKIGTLFVVRLPIGKSA